MNVKWIELVFLTVYTSEGWLFVKKKCHYMCIAVVDEGGNVNCEVFDDRVSIMGQAALYMEGRIKINISKGSHE